MKYVGHSVTLDKDKCCGCTICLKRCPTEAIRIINGKAVIFGNKCIDCGECIRVCPNHAKKAVVDTLDVLNSFEYTVALPAQTLYAQFPGMRDRNIVLTALKKLGFDDVFEVSVACDAISRAVTQDLYFDRLPDHVISSSCPTVVRIIRSQFPSLLPNLLNYRSPMELSARWAKKLAMEKTGLPKEKIGCVFISGCPAKATSSKHPLGENESYVDAVLSISEVYPLLQPLLKNIDRPEILARSGPLGVGWAKSGGEAYASQASHSLYADGIENVIDVLEALEDEKIHQARFIELNACPGGCVGGVLAIENPFIAKSRITHIMNHVTPTIPTGSLPEDDMHLDEEVRYNPALQLDSDVKQAMIKMMKIKELEKQFNGMDCGVCGAPSCHALAEDIIMGRGTEEQCIFRKCRKYEERIAQLEKTLEESCERKEHDSK
ncbi:MAG: 4Fe-4S binding protein [Firmicutes bacterium]|nr:4Fe-4S binding protein [Bacillota bacterium]